MPVSDSESRELLAKAHKATPSALDVNDCEVCGQRIKRVPGGSGPTYIHVDSRAVAAGNPPTVEAYLVGKSRGDDHANYALAYGHEISHTPIEIPTAYRPYAERFTLGWQDGIAEARKRDGQLDEPDEPETGAIIVIDTDGIEQFVGANGVIYPLSRERQSIQRVLRSVLPVVKGDPLQYAEERRS